MIFLKENSTEFKVRLCALDVSTISGNTVWLKGEGENHSFFCSEEAVEYPEDMYIPDYF